MKTYICNIPNFIKNFSKVLDYKTVLCDKIWHVLRDDQTNETYIFRQNGEILISVNGITSIGKFTILPMGAILIAISGTNYLVRPFNSESKDILAFNLDGTEQYSFLINENSTLAKTIRTHLQLENHYKLIEERKEKYAISKKQAEKEHSELEQLANKYQLGTLKKPYSTRYKILAISLIIICIAALTISTIYEIENLYIISGIILYLFLCFIVMSIVLDIYVENSDLMTISYILKQDINEKEKDVLKRYRYDKHLIYKAIYEVLRR